MIYVEVKEEKDSVEISTIGHAYSNEPGKDLVCCAISTLIQTLAYYLDSVHEEDEMIEFSIEEGNTYICADLNDKTKESVKTILFGIEQIAAQYIQYVNFRKI